MPVQTTPLFDPVRDTQQVFRVLLDVMARPGRTYHLPVTGKIDGLEGRFEPLGAVLLTLLDHEVTFCVLDQETEEAVLSRKFTALTGSHSVPRDQADYVVTLNPPDNNLPSQLKTGNLLYPNTSATLISLVPEISGIIPENGGGAKKPGTRLALSGPGVTTEQKFWVADTEAAFFIALAKANSSYPLGLDVIWITPEGKVSTLPRSSKIEILES